MVELFELIDSIPPESMWIIVILIGVIATAYCIKIIIDDVDHWE